MAEGKIFSLTDFLTGAFQEKRHSWEQWQTRVLNPIQDSLVKNGLENSIELEGTSYTTKSVVLQVAAYLGSDSFAHDIDQRLLQVDGKTDAFNPVRNLVNSKKPIWSDPQKPEELTQFFDDLIGEIETALKQVVKTGAQIAADPQIIIAALAAHRPQLTEVWERLTKIWLTPTEITLRAEIASALQDWDRRANKQDDSAAKQVVRNAKHTINEHNTQFRAVLAQKRQDEKTKLDRSLDKSSFILTAIQQWEQLEQAGFTAWYAAIENHLLQKYGDLEFSALNVDTWVTSLLSICRAWLDELADDNKTKITTATDNLNNYLADTLQITLPDITPTDTGGEGDTTKPEDQIAPGTATDIARLQRAAQAQINLIRNDDQRQLYERELAIKWSDIITAHIRPINFGTLTEAVGFLQQTLAEQSPATPLIDWPALLEQLRQILLESPLPEETPTSVVVKPEEVAVTPPATPSPHQATTGLTTATTQLSIQDFGEITRIQSLLVMQAENQITSQLTAFLKQELQREPTKQEIDDILNRYHADLTDIVWLQLVGHGGLQGRLPAAQLADVWVTASGVLLPRILSELPGQNKPSFDLTALTKFASDQEIRATQQLLDGVGLRDWQQTATLIQSLHHNGERLDEMVLLAQHLLAQDSNYLQEVLTNLVVKQSGLAASDSRVINYVGTILATLTSISENGLDLTVLSKLSRDDRARLILLLQQIGQGGKSLSSSELAQLNELLQTALPVLKTLQNISPEQLNLIFANLVGAKELLQFHQLRTEVNSQLQKMSASGVKMPRGAFMIAPHISTTTSRPDTADTETESAPHGRGDTRLKVSLAISNLFLEQARKEGLGFTPEQIEQYNLSLSVMVGEIVYGVPPIMVLNQPLLIAPQQWLAESNFADPDIKAFQPYPNFNERYASVAASSYNAGVQSHQAGSMAQAQKLREMMATVQKLRQMKMLFAAGTGGTGLILLALADPKIRKKVMQVAFWGSNVIVGVILGTIIGLIKLFKLGWAVFKSAAKLLFNMATFPIRSALGFIGNQIAGAASLLGLGNELALGTSVVKGFAGLVVQEASAPLQGAWTIGKAAAEMTGKSIISKIINQSYSAGQVAGQTLHAVTYADIFGPIVAAGIIVPFAFATIMTIIVMTVIGASLNDLPRDAIGSRALGMLNTTDMACISIDESSFSGGTDKLQQQVVKLMQNPYARQVCSFTGDITMRYMGTSTGFCRSFVQSYGCVEGNTVFVGDYWLTASEATGVFTLGHEIIHILQHTSDVGAQQKQAVGIPTIPTYPVCSRYSSATEHQAEAFALTFYTDLYPNSNNAYACEPSCGGGMLRCQFNIRSMPNIIDFVHQYLQP